MKRRHILLSAASLALMPLLPRLSPALADATEVGESERIIGDADAPITIIEYASLTCPHCASFHTDTLPQLKSEWLDEGKARLVYRHYPLDGLALRAAMVTDCLEKDRAFFGMLSALFKDQQQWARAEDPIAALQKHARLAGLGEERFNSCIEDEEGMNQVIRKLEQARETYEVQSTPTFIINGRKVEGNRSYEDLVEILEEVQEDT
ncbi:MAG: DsbA family protein [Pseudomonadota bacterium]|uniref:DsbA family protein n=1 Tax=Fodinicurvata fenggangensis TaxID=1121830 RepID=UPI0009DE9B99|nr:DsbA family protein [Fodinicurvata fenggangensis]